LKDIERLAHTSSHTNRGVGGYTHDIEEDVSLLILYGSWNNSLISTHQQQQQQQQHNEEELKLNSHRSALTDWLKEAICISLARDITGRHYGSTSNSEEHQWNCYTHNNTNSQLQVKVKVLSVKVDQDEETMNICIADTYTDSGVASNLHTLQAPAQLPALILVKKTISSPQQQQQPKKRSVFDSVNISPNQLTQCLLHYHNFREAKNPYLPNLQNALLQALNNNFSSSSLQHILTTSTSTSTSAITQNNHVTNLLHPYTLSPSHHPPLRIFVAGDKSQVGKSSVCLGLIGTLIHKYHYPPSSIAYIKPATQCEETQLVTKYCEKLNVKAVPVGPIVYYKGFTRAFLSGETESTSILLNKVKKAVDEIASQKQVVIIDGVGYPSVGSICGTDNADVALACGDSYSSDDNYNDMHKDGISNNNRNRTIPPAVLVVGKRGVGDAVDSYNLNAVYFRQKHVPVIGAIFNRLPIEKDNFYSLENCKTAITTYFNDKHNQRVYGGIHEEAFGFVPEIKGLSLDTNNDDDNVDAANAFVEVFDEHVDVKKILEKALELRNLYVGNHKDNVNDGCAGPMRKKARLVDNEIDVKMSTATKTSMVEPPPSISIHQKSNNFLPSNQILLTREEIESAAKAQGAAGG